MSSTSRTWSCAPAGGGGEARPPGGGPGAARRPRPVQAGPGRAAGRGPRGMIRGIRHQGWDRAVSALDRADEVCLACHVRPDGDALGSMLAVTHALTARGGRRVIASFGEQPFEIPTILRF